MSDKYYTVSSELNWYFNHSAASFGFKSSHAAFVAAVYGVSIKRIDPDTMTDGILKNARKYRRIRNLLFKLTPKIRRILDALYNKEYRYPEEITYLYGNKSGAVLFTSQIKDLNELISLCRKRKKSKLSDKEKIQMFVIGDEANTLFKEANEAYVKNWTNK